MPPSTPIVISQEELSQLENLTHNLCDLMTLLINRVALLPKSLEENLETMECPLFEQLAVITGAVAMAHHSFLDLLWIWGHIRDSKNQMTDTGKNEKHRAKTQGL